MIEHPKLTQSHQTGVKVVAIVTALLGALAFGVAIVRGGNFVALGGASAVLVGLSVYAMRLQGNLAARLSVAVASSGQIMVLLAAMAGHAWQLDIHMMFFAMLAVLTVMICPVAILAAAGVVAVHHLALTFLFPVMVYPSVDLVENLGRTIVHALIVVAETGILVVSVNNYRKQLQELAKEQQAQQDLMDTLNEEKASIETKEKVQTEVVETLHDKLTLISEGNLDAYVRTPFEDSYEDLRKSFNASVTSLSGIVSSVTTISNQIETDSRELREVSLNVAHSTEKQAGELQHVTEAVEQIADAMKGAVDKAVDTQNRFDNTTKLTREGTEVVRKAVSTMDEIEASSAQIDTVVALIEDIAFQTNLLALNAGVEAARAGEAGAGFAIVASEVRELAHRSAEAAQNINGLISQSNGHVSSGVSLVREVGEALETILGDVSEVRTNIAEISEISDKQAQSVAQIRDSMQTIGSETQANAARSEEASAATSSLDMAVDRLVDGLSGFRVAEAVEEASEDAILFEDDDDEEWVAA
ncbi:methyl-accepting chemotaxis protein [Shimia sp. MMG029]|uniref:methyl-accepting chemotaxis protein n=1 Tax=Shimia sp. MMG029 TaxID=3021978 RepID=UPI0022FE8210|nr:methyl-accepting chemotaxis protein [Shimia sp. MMG029]MDA5556790.1 methyl-accepting chemotaxis protein [Shimia sp. MMG029]